MVVDGGADRWPAGEDRLGGVEEDRRLADTRCNGDGYFGVTRPYAFPRA